MPCDQEIYQRIDFQQADMDVLKRALVRAGYSLSDNGRRLYFSNRNDSGQFVNGEFVVREGFDIAPIKAAYACEAVAQATNEYGWTLDQIDANASEITYEATRSSY